MKVSISAVANFLIGKEEEMINVDMILRESFLFKQEHKVPKDMK